MYLSFLGVIKGRSVEMDSPTDGQGIPIDYPTYAPNGKILECLWRQSPGQGSLALYGVPLARGAAWYISWGVHSFGIDWNENGIVFTGELDRILSYLEANLKVR